MSDTNPYTPPKAVVADAPSVGSIARPRLVDIAVMLMWTDLSIWSLTTIFDASAGRGFQGRSPVIFGVVLAFLIGINAWMIWKISTGRNWVRIIWIVLSLAGFIGQLRAPFPGGRLDQVSLIVQSAMTVAAIVILLMPAPARWFKEKSGPR